jgi:signal transduction histidine kinase
MTLGEVLFAITAGLVVNEASDVCPWTARKLVRWAAHHKYADPKRAVARAEEQEAAINDRPGKLLKLLTALGFVLAALAAEAGRVAGPQVKKLASVFADLRGLDVATGPAAALIGGCAVGAPVWLVGGRAAGLIAGLGMSSWTVGLSVARGVRLRRSLRGLRTNVLKIAEVDLPGAIQRLRNGEIDPIDLADITVDASEIDPRDEIAKIRGALDAVRQVAIRLATEQAALRSNVNTMFINLSRRSQALIERQLWLIGKLETGEQDPDQLSNLYKLDHLATRMRRNSENLLVLAGEDAGRVWSRPIPLRDLLREATGEVEQFHRIQLTGVPDVEVMGHAVNHVVHLVAELLENATDFSPPDSKVLVHCQRLSDGGAMIEIEDRGIGMTAQDIDDANERLASPPVFDVSISPAMGLYVVGRLSQHHGITVRLRQSAVGVGAFVRLPADLLADRHGRHAATPSDDVGVDAATRRA